jgi:nicotinamidase-related amidase
LDVPSPAVCCGALFGSAPQNGGTKPRTVHGEGMVIQRNPNLHGSVPDTSPVALILIDVINDLDFPGSEDMLPQIMPMAKRLHALKRRAQQAQIPVIYVNDNFGRWQSDFTKLVNHCVQDGTPGKPMVELLLPDEDDYFVLKPKHSGFFSTTLDTLLNYLGAKTLILTGIAGNICVLFTANDAYMRDYSLVVPADCVVSNSVAENEHALRQMQEVLKADITPSVELDLQALKADKRMMEA